MRPREDLRALVRSSHALDRARLDALLRACLCCRDDLSFAHLEGARSLVLAAGRGSRMNFPGPKVLFGGRAGRPILLRVLDVLDAFCGEPLVVVSESNRAEIAAAIASDGRHGPRYVLQRRPRGIGDAICSAAGELAGYRGDLLICWGDMGALNEEAVRLAGLVHRALRSELSFPTKTIEAPYVFIERDPRGDVSDARQSAEGDALPDAGEADCGVFWARCPEIFAHLEEVRAAISERRLGYERNKEFNFLPILRWLFERGTPANGVNVASGADCQGVNTLEDARRADDKHMELMERAEARISSSAAAHELLAAVVASTLTPATAAEVRRKQATLGAQAAWFREALPPRKREQLRRYSSP